MLKVAWVKYLLILCLGIVVGVFLCQISYFSINEEISLSDLFITFISAIVAIYIADNLAKKLSKTQSIKALFVEEIKAFINNLQKVEYWLDQGCCQAIELKRFLKDGTLKLNSFRSIYGQHKQLNTSQIDEIITSFNTFKSQITALTPTSKGEQYKFSLEEIHRFGGDLGAIKSKLIDLMVNA